jgi:hypothetical protein
MIDHHRVADRYGAAWVSPAATRNRRAVVRAFDRSGLPRFVNSLWRAAGIDLTAASVVIHYDRWWNAARENRPPTASIGSARRAASRSSLITAAREEKIDQMIKKAELMDALVEDDAATLGFSRRS